MRIIAASLAFMGLQACSQPAVRTGAAAGDIDINAFTAARTVLVRVQNNFPTSIRVFTVIGDRVSPIATLATDAVHTVALDPALFPGTSFSLVIVPEAGPSKRLGPFHLSKGETADLIVPPNLDSARVRIRPSTS